MGKGVYGKVESSFGVPLGINKQNILNSADTERVECLVMTDKNIDMRLALLLT